MATYQEQIERNRKQREEREKAEAERKASQLGPEQIKLWRTVLAQMVGPFAHVMPEAMVQQFRDRIQERLDKEHTAAEQRSTEEKS